MKIGNLWDKDGNKIPPIRSIQLMVFDDLLVFFVLGVMVGRYL